jgi:retinol dehydrogenase 12
MSDRMDGKTVIVTGATGGIGLVTARELAAAGARVLIVGRNEQKGAQALTEIKAKVPGADLAFHRADLSRMDEIRRLTRNVLETEAKLDVLVNNAGAFFRNRYETADGYEMTFALNHLSYFLLTWQMLDLLRAAPTARVVNVASRAHFGATLDFDDLQMRHGYRGWVAYQRSKLANILFTRALARRLEGSSITTNALHPGFVRSNFGSNNSLPFKLALRSAMAVMAISVEDGAKTSVYLASSPDVEGKSGGYYDNKCTEAKPSAAALDDGVGERLWRESEALAAV